MLSRLIYCLVVLSLLVAVSVGYAWKAESAGKLDRPIRGNGTAGNIAKWIDTNQLGDSVIVEDANGQVAIGTTPNILAKFLVVGTFDTPNSAIRGINNGTGRGVTGVSQNGIGINGGGSSIENFVINSRSSGNLRRRLCWRKSKAIGSKSKPIKGRSKFLGK